MLKPEQFNPFDPAVVETPWPFFSSLQQYAPVYELPNGAYHLVSRYEDVMQAVMDTEVFSSNLVAVLMASSDQEDQKNTSDASPEVLDLSSDGAQATDVLAIADPPIHTRQRRISNRAFTMRRVQAMEDSIRTLANQLIDQFDDKQAVDWVKDFAVPLPMTIIINMLGLPISDMPQLKKWSDASVALLSGINTAEQLAELGGEIAQLLDYLASQYDLALNEPGDNVLGDLIKEAKIDSEHLNRDEIVSMLVQLLSAGNETTTSLIGSALMLLIQTPDLQQQLRQHPEKIDKFIEEALRLESPFHGHFRVTTKATTLGGVHLKAGSRLMLLWSAANRDSQKFENPEEINLERAKPKSHLAFGYGIHHCIGAVLARMEAKIAIETILNRSSSLSLSNENNFKHVPSLFIRSLKKLIINIEK
jgi:cytochrome P450